MDPHFHGNDEVGEPAYSSNLGIKEGKRLCYIAMLFIRSSLMAYLSNHHLLSSQNLDELRETLNEAFIPHQLNITQKNSEVDASVYACAINNLSLVDVSYGEDVSVEARLYDEHCRDIITVNIAISGTGDLSRNGKHWELSQDKGMILDMQQPFAVKTLNCHGLALSFSTDVLKQHARSLIGDKVDLIGFEFDRTIDMTTLQGQALRNVILHAAVEMNGPLAALSNPIALANMENYLLTQFLVLQANSFMDVEQSTIAPSIMHRHVKRACDYIYAHAHEKILLQDLVDYAGCSYRTLQKEFNQTFAMPPMTYLTTVRLKYFREDLLDEQNSELTISKLANKWGFVHMGRLAKLYRKQYGTLPSETFRKKK